MSKSRYTEFIIIFQALLSPGPWALVLGVLARALGLFVTTAL